MKKLNIKEYANDIKFGMENEKSVGAFTIKLYASRIAIFRGEEYINELSFDKDTFDSGTKFASIETIEDVLEICPEIKAQMEAEEKRIESTTMDKVITFKIIGGRLSLTSEQIDILKDKIFIPADDETRDALIKVSNSTIINAKELYAIVGKLKDREATAPLFDQLKTLLKKVHPSWEQTQIDSEAARMMKAADLKVLAKQEAKIMKFEDLKTGDEFVFASDPKEIYKIYQLTKETAYLSQTVGAKVKNVRIPIKNRKDDIVYKMASKKKLKYFQKEPLKTMEDYGTTIKKMNPKTRAELEEIANGLYREAFGLWDSLKTVVDMISPFISFFVKNPKLKQAYNLLVDVIRERSAIYGDPVITITADEYLEKKYSQYGKDLFIELESHLLDKGKSLKDCTENDIIELIKSKKYK